MQTDQVNSASLLNTEIEISRDSSCFKGRIFRFRTREQYLRCGLSGLGALIFGVAMLASMVFISKSGKSGLDMDELIVIGGLGVFGFSIAGGLYGYFILDGLKYLKSKAINLFVEQINNNPQEPSQSIENSQSIS